MLASIKPATSMEVAGFLDVHLTAASNPFVRS